MNKEDVLRAAKEAGFECFEWEAGGGDEVVFTGCEGPVTEGMQRFAALVIADFLKRSGQYVTNDASREAVIAEAVAAEREVCAKRISALIVDGPLPGNGFDKTAERNGLILAYNTLVG